MNTTSESALKAAFIAFNEANGFSMHPDVDCFLPFKERLLQHKGKVQEFRINDKSFQAMATDTGFLL